MVIFAGYLKERVEGVSILNARVTAVILACSTGNVRADVHAAEGLYFEQDAALFDLSPLAAAALDSRGRGYFRINANLPPGVGEARSTATLLMLGHTQRGGEAKLASARPEVERFTEPRIRKLAEHFNDRLRLRWKSWS